jgi:hypothetical protein
MVRFSIMELIYIVLNFRFDLVVTYLRLFIPVDSTIFDQLREFQDQTDPVFQIYL